MKESKKKRNQVRKRVGQIKMKESEEKKRKQVEKQAQSK